MIYCIWICFVLDPTVLGNRFLLPVVGRSTPLCFDVPVPHKLRLLQDSASGYYYTFTTYTSYKVMFFLNNVLYIHLLHVLEFSMNGESTTGQNGFHQIVLHYKTNHHLTINTTSIRYHDGQNQVEFLWGQEPTQHNTEG